jgi:hypothetical protein
MSDLFNTHRSRAFCSLYTTQPPCGVRFPLVRMRGYRGRQGSCAPNSGALWLAMVRSRWCSHRLPYETATAELNEGTLNAQFSSIIDGRVCGQRGEKVDVLDRSNRHERILRFCGSGQAHRDHHTNRGRASARSRQSAAANIARGPFVTMTLVRARLRLARVLFTADCRFSMINPSFRRSRCHR